MRIQLGLLFLFIVQGIHGQTTRMRTVEELINKQEPGWELVYPSAKVAILGSSKLP